MVAHARVEEVPHIDCYWMVAATVPVREERRFDDAR
jgi:hypothetical protein